MQLPSVLEGWAPVRAGPLLVEEVLPALSFENSVAHHAAFLLVFKPLRAEPA